MLVISEFKCGIIQTETHLIETASEKKMGKVLLLNKECEPLNIMSWKRAFILLIKGKAEYLETLDRIEDYIKVGDYYIPRTIRLTYEMAIPELELPFSRENIFVRDGFTCQYCGRTFRYDELTLDHVLPKSRGGAISWENITTACKSCNQTKADRTPAEANMPLLNEPSVPDFWLFELTQKNQIEERYWGEYYKKAS